MKENASVFEYDVFVSYCSDDRRWVTEQLIEKLEGENFKVCYDRRCFKGGVSITTNITNAVESSRHTIAVLTPAFVASDWCGFEADLVKNHDPLGRRRRLIPVMLIKCRPPPIIAILTHRDFTNEAEWSSEWPLLFEDLHFGQEPETLATAPLAAAQTAVASVDTGVRALALLAHESSAVSSEVRSFEPIFERMNAGLQKFKKYFALHDFLDSLDLQVFRRINHEIARFPKDPLSREQIELCANDLDRLIHSLQSESFPFAQAWIEKLLLAQSRLRHGLRIESAELVRSGIRSLERIIALEPTRVEVKIYDVITSLPIADTVDALAQIHAVLLGQEIDPESLGLFKSGAEQLFNLKQQLNHAVSRHDALQHLNRRLRLFETEVSYDDSPDPIRPDWDAVNQLVSHVLTTHSAKGYTRIRDTSKKLAAAIAGAESRPRILIQTHKLRSVVEIESYQAMRDLFLCAERLQVISESISQLLDSMTE